MVGEVCRLQCLFGDLYDAFRAITQEEEVGGHLEDLLLLTPFERLKVRVAFECLLLFGAFGCLIEHGCSSEYLKGVFVERTQQPCREGVVDIIAHTVHIGIGKDIDHIELFLAGKV